MRKLFAAGKVAPRRTMVCGLGLHYGKPLRADVYEAAGGMWSQVRDCSACGSSVHVRDFVRVAA